MPFSICRPARRLAHLLLALPALLASSAHAQSVALTGTGFTNLEGETLRAVRAVPGGYINYFYTGLAPSAPIRQGQFSVAFAPAAGGELVSIQAKTFPQLYAFVEPGAPVLLRQTGSGPVSEAALSFEGPNAAGNNLLRAGRLLNRRAGVDQERVRLRMAPGTTPKAVLGSLHDELRTCLARLDSVRRRQLISAACYASLRAETEQSLLFWVGRLVGAYENTANRPRLDFHVTEAGLHQVLPALEKEFDPYLPKYQGHFMTINTIQDKYHFQAMGWLPGPPPTRYWNRYDKQFKDIFADFGNIDYAPVAVQRLLIGDDLLTALAFRTMSEADFATVYQDFVQHFPTSPYVGALTQALLHEHATAAASAPAGSPASAQGLGYYDAKAGQLTFAPAAGIDTVSSIGALVRQQFPGKAVFVDFWATWCAPCLAEFGQEAELHAFLESQGVKPLYVSVNNEGYRAKWREFVAQYKLRGYHYLASPKVQKSLEKLLARGIPRYLLFDANGQLLDDDLPLPSTGEALRQRIRHKLATK
jgi:thiol-disulfide isomerase/thioredoxin